jgi:succinate-acetate transporter protein
MVIENKVFATALVMANVCVYILHMEYGMTMHKTIFMHLFFTVLTLLFHYLTIGFNHKKIEDDESVSDQ